MHYFNSNLIEDFSIKDCDGPWLIDIDDNFLFDCWLGSGSLLYGHEKLTYKNINKMLPEGDISLKNNINLIDSLVDFEVGAIGIQTSGSSAITRACRVARAITGRRLIALIGDFWHGSEDEFLFKRNYDFISDGLAIQPSQNYVWFESIASFLSSSNIEEFAAILIEPSQGSNPSKNLVKDLLDVNIRERIRNLDILLIFDEIITGCRDCYGSSRNSRGCKPDIVVFGKSIGGGYPIGLVLVDERYTEKIRQKNIFWGGTFSGNPAQIELLFKQLIKLKNLNFELILNNLDNICVYLLELVKINNIGFTISKGSGFARILPIDNDQNASRGFLNKETNDDTKLNQLCRENMIYIPRNRIVFASTFNIKEIL